MDPSLYQRFFEIEDWYWWAVATRAIFHDLVAETGICGRVLDVGCGTGAFLAEFPPGWSVVAGSDHFALPLSFCRKRGLRQLVRSSGTALPFTTGSFDLVMAIDVIEHLDDDAASVREMARLCRPGGYILIHVPAFEILWTDKDVASHHRRRYRRRQLQGLLEGCGLRIETIFHINTFLFPVALLRAAEQKIRWTIFPKPSASAEGIDHLYRIPPVINRLMTGLAAFDHWLFGRSAPFGLSLVCLASKATTADAATLRRS